MIEIFLFTSKLTPTKVINFLKTLLSFFLSLLFRKPIVWGQAWSLSIEPIALCNLQCPECAIGSGNFHREKGQMNMNLYQSIIEKTYKNLLHLFLYFQGEPFLCKNIFEMIQISHSKKIFTVISTNAQLINEEMADNIVFSGLDKIIISLDGILQESYSAYRKGGSLERVLNAIRFLVRSKEKYGKITPFISVQFLVLASNEREILEARKLCKDLGVNEFKLKTAQFNNFNENTLMPKNEKWSRYKKNKEGKYILKNKLSNRCKRLWFSSVLGFDGKMAVCCFDKDIMQIQQNIENNTFIDVWRSNELMEFRAKILQNRKSIGICRNCIE